MAKDELADRGRIYHFKCDRLLGRGGTGAVYRAIDTQKGEVVALKLFGNIPPGVPEPTAWPLQHAELYTLLWSAAFLLVFVPLANAQYRVSTSR